MGIGDLIRAAESGGDPNARNPRSSASGPDQFIDDTWLRTIRVARPDLAGQSDADLLALKTNPEISGQVRDTYAAQNGEILSKAGLPVTPGTTYLAHFAGPQGAVSVLSADPATPVSSVLSPGAIKANQFLQGMTVADLRAWADRKMGGAQPAPAASPAPANEAPRNLDPRAIPAIAPPSGLPMGSIGIRGDAPEVAPFAPPQMAQLQPIFSPPRRQIDLSKLRAALAQNRGFFNRTT